MAIDRDARTSRRRTAIVISIIAVTLALMVLFYAIVGVFVLAFAGLTIGLVAVIISGSFDNLTYEAVPIHGGYAIVEGYGVGEVTIPDYIDGEPVLVIAEDAFKYSSSLTKITLPSTLKSIDTGAFSECTRLKEIVVPDSVEYIGDSAFYMCESLERAIIGNGTRFIGNEAFSECTSLRSVALGDGLEEIGTQAFNYCTSLEELDLGSGVEKIGSHAFNFCTSLTEVYIPRSVKQISAGTFWGCEKLENVYFENAYNWKVNGNSFNYEVFSDSSLVARHLTTNFHMYDWINTGSWLDEIIGQ